MIKIELGRSMARARQFLQNDINNIVSQKEYKTVNIAIDVDAQ
jgi:hypothetical protein